MENYVFDNSILADEFAIALWRFETFLLVSNNLWRKLASSLESSITFDDKLRIISISFFSADFTLFSCEFDNFYGYGLILSHFILVLHQDKTKFTTLSQIYVKNHKWFLSYV